MKALTLTQPWASLVAWGEKTYETRSWSTRHRGTLAIHASREYSPVLDEYPNFRDVLEHHGIYEEIKLPHGEILAVVDLIMVHRTENVRTGQTLNEITFGDWTDRRYAWEFRELRALKEPIECRGAQQLWNVQPEVEAQIREQLGNPQINFEEAIAAREEAIATVDENASEHWKACAKHALTNLSNKRTSIIAPDVADYVTENFPDAHTHDPRAMGPIMQWGVREGLIFKTELRRKSGRPRDHNHECPVFVTSQFGERGAA